MKAVATGALLLYLTCSACGGLKHIPVLTSEANWRHPQSAESPPASADAPRTTVPSLAGTFVAVFDIEDRSKRLKPSEVDGLTEYLAGKLAEGGLFHVIPRQQIKQRLLEQKKSSFRKCYDQSCQIEIGREMAAQKVLSTVVAAVGSSCLVTAALFDLKKAATEITASARGGCSADDLLNQIEQVVGKLRRASS